MRARRPRVAALLPSLVLAAATVASPFAGTTTARLAADQGPVHAAPVHAAPAPRLPTGTSPRAPGNNASSPASKGVNWKIPTGSVVVLTLIYLGFGGLGALTLMWVARRRGRKVTEVLPQPWEFWRGMTHPIRASHARNKSRRHSAG